MDTSCVHVGQVHSMPSAPSRWHSSREDYCCHVGWSLHMTGAVKLSPFLLGVVCYLSIYLSIGSCVSGGALNQHRFESKDMHHLVKGGARHETCTPPCCPGTSSYLRKYSLMSTHRKASYTCCCQGYQYITRWLRRCVKHYKFVPNNGRKLETPWCRDILPLHSTYMYDGCTSFLVYLHAADTQAGRRRPTAYEG